MRLTVSLRVAAAKLYSLLRRRHRSAVLEVDTAMKVRRQPPGDSAFRLAIEALRIDHHTAIDSAHDAMDPNIAGLLPDGNFRHLRDEAVRIVDVAGNAAPPEAVAGMRKAASSLTSQRQASASMRCSAPFTKRMRVDMWMSRLRTGKTNSALNVSSLG